MGVDAPAAADQQLDRPHDLDVVLTQQRKLDRIAAQRDAEPQCDLLWQGHAVAMPLRFQRIQQPGDFEICQRPLFRI